MKNLESLGVQELNYLDCETINGGFLKRVAAALIYFAVETVTNPKASYDAFMKGFEKRENLF